jgi:anti-sigma factor RsiW
MMSTHLSEKQLVGYVHRTLTDARREAMDQHLAACPRCRARLADHEALQRRINYSLLADLKVVRPSPQMTFAAIAPRLRRPKMFVSLWGQSQRLLSGAAALVVLVLQAVILIALFEGMSQPVNGSTLASAGPSSTDQPPIVSGGDVQLPDGWSASGSHPQDYEMGVDHTVAHGGRASGYVRPKVSDPAGYGTLMQVFAADDYRGKRIRMSGYIKVENVAGRAGLWMRVDGPEGETMQDRPVTGTTGWEKFQVILDVPPDSDQIAFGVLLKGAGIVWVDDFQFEVVGDDVPTTN